MNIERDNFLNYRKLVLINILSIITFQDLEAIKARVREMEEEALKLKELQSEVDKQIGVGSPQHILDRSNSNTSVNMSYEEKVRSYL